MDLGDIYQNNINKNSIGNGGMSGGMPSSRERDPNQIKLEQDVFSKMRAALPKNTPTAAQPPAVNDIQPVDIKQAMQELLDSTETIDDKS
tara:strand:+ start:549 stop:818 length:270 start_codon:yes stop_codon:yes gene_type:complete